MNRFQRMMTERAQRIVIEKAVQALQNDLDAMSKTELKDLLNLFNSGIVVDIAPLKKLALNLGIEFLENHLKKTHKKR